MKQNNTIEVQCPERKKVYEAIGTLLLTTAYDITDIAQIILGYAEVLLVDKNEESQDFRCLKEIESSAQELGALAQQVFILSEKLSKAL
ncbi:MAG: hypothetical protein JRI41_10065 [Deltaproteobacteria bacterium]|nr:hypothetical protein [Deltaproteobacteria bacterium]